MTPQEITNYKTEWMKHCTNLATINEDSDLQAKRWCRANLKQQEWHFVPYTDVYEHSILFEHAESCEAFECGYNAK